MVGRRSAGKAPLSGPQSRRAGESLDSPALVYIRSNTPAVMIFSVPCEAVPCSKAARFPGPRLPDCLAFSARSPRLGDYLWLL